jgi:hypothetical protein
MGQNARGWAAPRIHDSRRAGGRVHANGLRDVARDGGERHGKRDACNPGLPDDLPAAHSATDQPGEGEKDEGGDPAGRVDRVAGLT